MREKGELRTGRSDSWTTARMKVVKAFASLGVLVARSWEEDERRRSVKVVVPPPTLSQNFWERGVSAPARL